MLIQGPILLAKRVPTANTAMLKDTCRVILCVKNVWYVCYSRHYQNFEKMCIILRPCLMLWCIIWRNSYAQFLKNCNRGTNRCTKLIPKSSLLRKGTTNEVFSFWYMVLFMKWCGDTAFFICGICISIHVTSHNNILMHRYLTDVQFIPETKDFMCWA